MYSYLDKFSISQERDPILRQWISQNTPLVEYTLDTPERLKQLDVSYHVDYLYRNSLNKKSLGVSMRTLNIEADVHREYGYGLHLRALDERSNTPKEFFKNTQKFSPENFKRKTGLDSMLLAQGFFKHSPRQSPILIGAILVELKEVLEVIKEGCFLKYTLGKNSSRPNIFVFVPFFELLPKVSYCKFQLADLSSNVYVKSGNMLQS